MKILALVLVLAAVGLTCGCLPKTGGCPNCCVTATER